jgi:hypothetical protein
MSAAGGQVESVREIRPTFEDVFAHLVERDRAARAADPSDPAYEKNEGDRPPDPDAPGTPYAAAPGASDEPRDEAVGPSDDPAAPSDEAA